MLSECQDHERKQGGGQNPPIMMSGQGATKYAKILGILTSNLIDERRLKKYQKKLTKLQPSQGTDTIGGILLSFDD
jgi:hypothetical protein